MNLYYLACSTCRTSMIDGGGDAAGYSIFALLVVILSVLGGVGFYMIRMISRDGQNLDPELQDDYVHQ
ncbi:MAG: hypothetical protein V4727_09285 [Verrucomicrobiota bacterium]